MILRWNPKGARQTCLVDGAARINLEVQEATVTSLTMPKSRGLLIRKEQPKLQEKTKLPTKKLDKSSQLQRTQSMHQLTEKTQCT